MATLRRSLILAAALVLPTAAFATEPWVGAWDCGPAGGTLAFTQHWRHSDSQNCAITRVDGFGITDAWTMTLACFGKERTKAVEVVVLDGADTLIRYREDQTLVAMAGERPITEAACARIAAR